MIENGTGKHCNPENNNRDYMDILNDGSQFIKTTKEVTVAKINFINTS